MLKRLAVFLLLLTVALPLAPLLAQSSKPTTDAPVQTVDSTPQSAPQPHITAVNPPPQQAAWSWHDMILWAATVALVFIAYAGVMIANATLKRIELQTTYVEEAAKAAHESSNAALESANAAQQAANAAVLQTQALIAAERPWILITVEPSLKVENGFMVTATNRGRGPAKIVQASDRIGVAADETQLPETPEYSKEESSNLPLPLILLPGESAGIRAFCREDVKWVCKTPESMRRVEYWQEKIFLYGKITYLDLVTAAEQPSYETDWCCWYIHGEKKSGMVIAGPPDYNRHS